MLLRAAVNAREELGQGRRAVLGVELVLLLDPDPGQIATRSRDLLVSLGLIGLELRELVPGHLPLLAGSDPVFRHLIFLQSDSSAPARAESIVALWLTGSRNKTPDDPETHRNPPRSPVAAMSFPSGTESRYRLVVTTCCILGAAKAKDPNLWPATGGL